MTTIYVDPNKKKEQVVTLSDGSQGMMTAKKSKGGIAYEFDFTNHIHPSFVMMHAPVDDDVENVDTIEGKQAFQIHLK